MFKIKFAKDVPAKVERVYLGAPSYTTPDLVFTTEFSRDIIISMNSSVLKTALLNSKELLESYLGVKVTEVNVVPEKKSVKKPVKEPKPKGETKLEWK